MPRRLKLAVLIAIALNGVLILTARYHLSYDAYTHMLLADHYRTGWWSLWDPVWYAGFAVNSYPPLVHQVIGLLGGLVGVDAGYAAVQWLAAAAAPLAVYTFSRVFVDEGAAGYASLGAALLPSFYLSAYAFGQLPTLVSLVFALFAAAALAEFLRTGRRLGAALAVGLAALVVASHHATLLFLPPAFLAVALHLLLDRQVRWKTLILRFAVFAALAAAAGLLVVWPFWQWGLGQTLQTPIDHATRHNYFTDGLAALVFFWAMYGPLVLVVPFALWKGLDRRFTALTLAFIPLFVLGLGGTTPLPAWIFGASWQWLTYDRFALWASVLLLPFFGLALVRFRRAVIIGLPMLAIFSGLVSLIPTLLPTQPSPIAMQPVVDFLAQPGRSQFRYVTFGFGDQFASLNRLTTATTIDGSYFTARTLPELRTSGLGQIDSAYWLAGGLQKLDPILQASGKYGVRWGFVDLRAYDPVLLRNGWVYRSTLSNGVEVWENPAATLPAPAAPPPEDPLAVFSWGVLPLLALLITGGLAGLRFRPALAQKVLYAVHAAAVGLLPLGLSFWYFAPLTNNAVPRVYFTYNNALFYLADGLAFAAVLAWGLGRAFGPVPAPPQHGQGHSLVHWARANPLEHGLLGLCCLATASAFWSLDWRLSLYTGLHLWLVFGLFLSLRDRPSVLRFAAAGFCAALAIQALVGIWEVGNQSTAFLSIFHLNWPGTILPSTSGASIVQLIDGSRWLRAYGTLPHPNILGALVVALLAGPALFFLAAPRVKLWPAPLFAAGMGLLIVTFSRAAWIGALCAGLFVLFKLRHLIRARLVVLGLGTGLALAAAVFPLRQLVFTRIADTAIVPAEQFSIYGRTWLAGQALSMIAAHPILGSGAGTFPLELVQRAPLGYLVEPVHDVPLLIASDLGLLGVLLLLAAAAAFFAALRKVRRPETAILGAALLGLGVTGLFDHLLWTLAPGRLLIGLMLGLWAGQVRQDAA